MVAVVGPGRDASPDELAAAEEAGAAIAEAGAVAGLRRARRRDGGRVPRRALRAAGRRSGCCRATDREEANGWVVLAMATGLGEGRNALIVRAADAVVAIGGGWGTLTEIAFALRAGVPVFGVGTWESAREARRSRACGPSVTRRRPSRKRCAPFAESSQTRAVP